MILLISKMILGAGFLYGYYLLFLRNKQFHRYNRFYLIVAALATVIIPFLNIPLDWLGLASNNVTIIKTLKVVAINEWEPEVTIYAHRNHYFNWVNWQNVLMLVYAIGLLLGLYFFIRALLYIMGLKKKYALEYFNKLQFFNTSEKGTPFSFFNNIFWNRNISLNTAEGQQIFRHELFHVQEKHSADILLMEILCCICWFNPFLHLIKREIKAIHEFLADEHAVANHNRYDYAELLVLQAIQQKTLGLTNNFFHNHIKRRITMITKSNLVRHGGYISRIMALPLLFIMVSAFAVKFTNSSKGKPTLPFYDPITVVIDAGHGGQFIGASGVNGLLEKDLTLSIAKKIKDLAGAYNIKVIMTRTEDKLVGNATSLKEDLENRVQITNLAKAVAFISIHINATDSKIIDSSGFQAYISGRRIDPLSAQLGSTLLTGLKIIYSSDEIVKQRSEGIHVLDKCNIPAVILECGWINNTQDAAFISLPENQEKIAKNILESLVKFAQQNRQTAQQNHISAEYLSKMDPGEVQSVKADLSQSNGIVYLKKGGTKSFNINEVNEYYKKNKIEGQLKGYKTNVNMVDSVVEITYQPINQSKEPIFTKVEFEAEYPGGQKEWNTYLTKNMVYPQAAIAKEIQGTVVVEFIVNKLGEIRDIKAISGPEELKAASILVIKNSGKWMPAKQNGRVVTAFKKQPIVFKLK